MLALLEFNFSSGTSLDHCNTTGELSQALLELLAVVVGVGVVDLGTDLSYAASNLVCVASTLNDGGLVLGDNNLASLTQHVEFNVLELEADFFSDDLTTGEDGDVLKHGLAAVTEARSLDGYRLEDATDLVDHEGCECFAIDVFRDDEQLLAGLDDLVHDGQQVLDVGNLAVHDEDVRVLEYCFLTLWVSHEVCGEVTLVEAHTFGELELGAESVGLLNGDHTFLTDLVDSFSDQCADLGVSSGDRSGSCDLFLGLNFLSVVDEFLGNSCNSLLNAALERNGVCASSYVAKTFANECLSENGSGGRSITSDVISLLGNFLNQLCADLFEWVVQFDFLRDGHTIVSNRGGAPLLFEDDVASAWAKGDLDGVSKDVQTAL